MPSIDDVYKSHSDKLKAEELGTRMYTLTIRSVEFVEFSDTDKKLVLSFTETEKTLPLNVTNARSIAGFLGNDYGMWSGRQIMLFSTPVDFQGRQVLGIRIRAPQDAPIQAPAQVQQPLNGGANPFAGQPMTEATPPAQEQILSDEIPF